MNIKGDLTDAQEAGDASSAVKITAGDSLDWLFVCDHASNSIPRDSDSLGLSPQALQDHIAWDIGAARIARGLALRFGAPLIESGYSRLLIDCNRYPDAADSIVTVTDRRVVRGNQDISPAQRLERRSAYFRPYHLAIDAALCEAERRGHTPVFISVHTCTASLNGLSRPWDVGISWSRDERVARPVLERLAGMQGVTVGDNQPYALEIGKDFTTPEHAMLRGLAHLQLEVRQDLLRTAEAADWWADQLYGRIRDAHSGAIWNRRHHVLTSADNVHGIEKWL
jgi:predicted N-formylglutamate amidohydrolase